MPDGALRFALNIKPVPKGRPRIGRGRAYTPARTREFETAVGWAAKQAATVIGWAPATEPVVVTMTFRQARRNADLDNLAKSVLDGITGIAYADDCQVEGLVVWRTDKGPPGVDVEVRR